MASITEAIRRLTIQSTTTGVTQSTAELEKLAAAQGGVTVASQATERATLSLDQKFASIEKRYISSVRAQAEYEKVQRQVNLAVAQNPALQDRANAVLAAAAERYDQVSRSQKAFGIASSALNLQVAALAGGLGLTGQILSALGPAGFAAAVGLGVVQSGLQLASDKAHELAAKSKEIYEFAEATGLTTRQFQALRAEAGKFGVDSETLAGGLQKFSVGFDALRLGEGTLLENIRRVNPAIADQMQRTTDAAEAFTLFSKAVSQTDNVFQRNALLKSGLGKGSAVFGGFLETSVDVGKLTASFDQLGKGIDKNMIEKLRQLEIDIARTKSAANNTFAGLFGSSTLEAELEFHKGLLAIAQELRDMKMSVDLIKFIDFITGPAIKGLLAGAAGGGLLGALFGGVGAVPGAIIGAGIGFAGGSVVSAGSDYIQSRGRSTSPTLPPPPDFNATFGANFKPSVVDAATTLEAAAAKARVLVGALGSAASPGERLAAAMADLAVKAKKANLSEADLARAQAGLNLDAAIEQQNAHNAALGASATIADLARAKYLQLQKLQQQGAGLTASQMAFQIELTKAQALGTYQIDQQTDAEKVRLATLFMSAEAGTAYAIVQTKINDGIRNGNPLTGEQISKLQASADAFAKVRVTADAYSEAISTISSSATTTLVGGLADITDGTKTASAGFKDMSKSIIRAIEEMVIKIMIVQPLVRSLQSSLGGLGSLFGGGGGAELANWGSPSFVGPLASAKGNIFANDNLVPFKLGGTFTNSIVDRPTLFPFAKGTGLMGEAGPEAIMPLRRGADGSLGVAATSAAPKFQFNIMTPAGTTAEQGSFQSDGAGGGSMDIVVKKAVQGAVLEDAATNGPMSQAIAARQRGFAA